MLETEITQIMLEYRDNSDYVRNRDNSDYVRDRDNQDYVRKSFQYRVILEDRDNPDYVRDKDNLEDRDTYIMLETETEMFRDRDI